MNSIKCPQCGLTNWADAQLCKKCGFELQTTHFGHGDRQSGLSVDSRYSPEYYPSPQTKIAANPKTGLAIASMVVGIVALVSCGFGLVIAPVGLILGIISLVRSKKNAHIYGGRGFAIAGITTSAVSFVVVVPIIAAIAIPNFLAARRAAYEANAMKNVATLAGAEQRYLVSRAAQQCADLATLRSKDLIDQGLASGEMMGYRFTVLDEQADRVSCGIQATPVSNDGSQSFYFSTKDGLMRAARKGGLPADRNDPMLGSDPQQRRR